MEFSLEYRLQFTRCNDDTNKLKLSINNKTMINTKTTKTIGGGTLTVTPKEKPYNEYPHKGAFAVIKSDGSVVTWWRYGDDSSIVLDGNIPVTQIYTTRGAFAVLRSDGSVVSWGDSGGGRRQHCCCKSIRWQNPRCSGLFHIDRYSI